MDEESNRLAALLNISTPANPGKPVPWPPPPAPDDPPAADDGTESMPASAPDSATERAGVQDDGDQGEDEGGVPAPAELPPWDPAAVSEVFGRTIAAAEAQHAQLETALAGARERTYAGESADGEVRVTVDGRPRVVGVHVSARAVRDGAGPLGAAIAEAANAAMRAAGDGTNEALLGGLDPAMRAAVEDGLAAGAAAGSAPAEPGPAGETGRSRR
jgi:DNA-binding protein YbaB